MKAALRITLVGAGTLMVLVVGVIAVFWYFAPDLYGNEVLAEYPSPREKHRVVVFQRDCGATTGFSTQASILKVDEPLKNVGGNVFTSDTNHGAAPSGPGGGPALFVTWLGENSVAFSYHPNTRVFRMEPEMDGAQVTYSKSAQPGAPADAKNRAAER